MSKFSGNDNLNKIFFEIVSKLLADDKQEAIDLKKLLYYENYKNNTGELVYVNPYKKPFVKEDLYNKNIYQYDYIFDIQKEVRSIINIHFAGGDIRHDNYATENDYFNIDIYVHKDMEAIEVDNLRVARSIEILNKLRKLLDGEKIFNKELNLQRFNGYKIQDKYILISCEFKIINIR